MKKLLLLFVFGVLIAQIQAQEITYEHNKSTVQKDKFIERTPSYKVFDADDEYIYVLAEPYEHYYTYGYYGPSIVYRLQTYDRETLKRVDTKLMHLGKKYKKYKAVSICSVNDKYCFITSFKDKKAKKQCLYLQNINKETFEIDTELKLLAEIDYKDIKGYSKPNFKYEFSPDSSKVLIYFNLLDKENNVVRYGMYVYDNNFELIWKNENMQPSFIRGVFAYQDFMVSNKGDVYIKGINYLNLENYYIAAKLHKRTFFSSDTYYTDYPNYICQIYKYSANDKSYTNLELDGKFIRNFTLLPQEDGSLLCSGIYSKKGTISAIGSFVFDLDIENDDITNVNTKEFGVDLIENGIEEKFIDELQEYMENDEEWDPHNYELSDILIDSDGNKYMIAEQYLEGTKVIQKGSMTEYKSLRVHNDIYVIRIGDDNEIGRIDKIRKRQYIVGRREFSSYILLEKNSNLFFVFKNFVPDKVSEIGKEACIVKLDVNGNQTKEAFQSDSDKNAYYIMSTSAKRISENCLAFISQHWNNVEYRMNTITLE